MSGTGKSSQFIYLTKAWRCDIMNKLQRVKRLRSCDEKERERMNFTKCSKTFTKSSLDKFPKAWYNIKVAARKCRQQKVMSNTVSWKLNNALQVQRPLKFKRASEKTIKNTNKSVSNWQDRYKQIYLCIYNFTKEFDPGSGRTLAARLTHASRTEKVASVIFLVADGWVTREEPASESGIASGNGW